MLTRQESNSNIDALIAQGYTRVQAIKIHYQQNLARSQSVKDINVAPQVETPGIVKEQVTKLTNTIQDLNKVEPFVSTGRPRLIRREDGKYVDEQGEVQVVEGDNLLDASPMSPPISKTPPRKPLNLRPLASIHGRSGFVEEVDDVYDEEEEVEPFVESPRLNPATMAVKPLSGTASPSTPSDSEAFIATMMAQGYKRDEAFLMYLRKINAEKAEAKRNSSVSAASAIMNEHQRSYSGLTNGKTAADPNVDKELDTFMMNQCSADSYDYNSPQRPGPPPPSYEDALRVQQEAEALRLKQEAARLQQENEALRLRQEAEALRIQQEAAAAMLKQQQAEILKQQEAAQLVARQQEAAQQLLMKQQEAALQLLREQEAAQQLLKQQEAEQQQAHLLLLAQQQQKIEEHQRQLEMQQEQARRYQEEQQQKLRAQQEEHERVKQQEILEQKRLLEQIEQQRLQQEEQQRRLIQQQAEQQRLMEEQWAAQQRQMQQNLLDQQAKFQQEQAEKLLEQQLKLEEHHLELQRQQELRLLEQKLEQERKFEEMQAAKRLEMQVEAQRLLREQQIAEEQRIVRERQLAEQQLESQRMLQEKQNFMLLEQQRVMQERQQQILADQLLQQQRAQEDLAAQKVLEQQQYQLQQKQFIAQQQQQLEQQTQHQQHLEQQQQIIKQQQEQQNLQLLAQQQQKLQLQEQQAQIEQQHFLQKQRLIEQEHLVLTEQQLLAEQHSIKMQRQQQQFETEIDDFDDMRSLNGSVSGYSRRGSAPFGKAGAGVSQRRQSHAQLNYEYSPDEYEDMNFVPGNYEDSPYESNRKVLPNREPVSLSQMSPENRSGNSRTQMTRTMTAANVIIPIRERGPRNDDDDDMSSLSSATMFNLGQQQNGRRYSGGGRLDQLNELSEEDEDEIEAIMSKGYPREIAIQLWRQKGIEQPKGRPSHRHSSGGSVSGMSLAGDRGKPNKRRMTYSMDTAANNPDFNADHEALKMGLLLSQQESEFGINMYDSLIPADDPLIEEYAKLGFTMDEAVLKIFEYKFGKVSTQITEEENRLKNPTKPLTNATRKEVPAVSTLSAASGSLFTSTDSMAAPPVRLDVAENLETEIALLVTAGYTREVAVKLVLQRIKTEKERGLQSDSRSVVSMADTHSSNHTSSLSNAQFSTHNAHNAHNTPRSMNRHQSAYEMPAPPISPTASVRSMVRPASMYDSTPAQQMRVQERLQSPAEQSFSQYSPPPSTSYRTPPPPPLSPEYNYPPPRLLTAEIATADDRAFEIALLLSEQESAFGENMYDSLTQADDAEIRKLTSRGYSTEDAALAVFERKHKVHSQNTGNNNFNAPVPARNANNRSNMQISTDQHYQGGHSRGSSNMSNYNPHSPSFQSPHSSGSNFSNFSESNRNSYTPSGSNNDYNYPSRHSPAQGLNRPASRENVYHDPNNHANNRRQSGNLPPSGRAQGTLSRVSSRSSNNDEDDVTIAIQRSQAENKNRPGVERVAGFASSSGSVSSRQQPPPSNINSQSQYGGQQGGGFGNNQSVRVNESDVGQLMNMGFSREQSTVALMQNNQNLEVALDKLLNGAY